MELRPVPSAFTGAQREWLVALVDQLRHLPVFSAFSGTTPESVVTGVAGNWAYNPFSTTTNNALFYKWGSAVTASKVSWTKVSVSTVS